ncbi:MAG: DUF3486 family protein [Hylemonella sp.]|nr:DUF3486 family protein [Hylemonella sp.]MDP1936525.1 DUF3486 family protein [Hylemonella sp.]
MSAKGRHLAARLPPPVRDGLDAMFRQNAYGDLDAAGAWLLAQGHSVSRSSIHRYAQRLRAVDAESGRGVAPLLTVTMRPRQQVVEPGRRGEILAEITRLHGLQTALLTELASLPACSNIVSPEKNNVARSILRSIGRFLRNPLI